MLEGLHPDLSAVKPIGGRQRNSNTDASSEVRDRCECGGEYSVVTENKMLLVLEVTVFFSYVTLFLFG